MHTTVVLEVADARTGWEHPQRIRVGAILCKLQIYSQKPTNRILIRE